MRRRRRKGRPPFAEPERRSEELSKDLRTAPRALDSDEPFFSSSRRSRPPTRLDNRFSFRRILAGVAENNVAANDGRWFFRVWSKTIFAESADLPGGRADPTAAAVGGFVLLREGWPAGHRRGKAAPCRGNRRLLCRQGCGEFVLLPPHARSGCPPGVQMPRYLLLQGGRGSTGALSGRACRPQPNRRAIVPTTGSRVSEVHRVAGLRPTPGRRSTEPVYRRLRALRFALQVPSLILSPSGDTARILSAHVSFRF